MEKPVKKTQGESTLQEPVSNMNYSDMSISDIRDFKTVLGSFLRLRKTVGILGIFLPFIILYNEGMLPSISHSYYTSSAVFFIITLSFFGFFLIAYKGSNRNSKKLLNDNMLTNMAGILALVVALVPTACENFKGCFLIDSGHYLMGHTDQVKSMIHFYSAALFFIIMGWMSYFRFTKTGEKLNFLYRTLGIVIWSLILILFIESVSGWQFSDYDIFIGEIIVILAFGISWFVKGKALEEGNELWLNIKKISRDIKINS